jgi:hypothetical protein
MQTLLHCSRLYGLSVGLGLFLFWLWLVDIWVRAHSLVAKPHLRAPQVSRSSSCIATLCPPITAGPRQPRALTLPPPPYYAPLTPSRHRLSSSTASRKLVAPAPSPACLPSTPTAQTASMAQAKCSRRRATRTCPTPSPSRSRTKRVASSMLRFRWTRTSKTTRRNCAPSWRTRRA